MRTLIQYLLLVFGISLLSSPSLAQSTTGALTIAFTVEPSSTILVLPDGKLQVYIANPLAGNDARSIYFPPPPPDTKHDDAVREERSKVAVRPKKNR